jgi:hypothetical protein
MITLLKSKYIYSFTCMNWSFKPQNAPGQVVACSGALPWG